MLKLIFICIAIVITLVLLYDMEDLEKKAQSQNALNDVIREQMQKGAYKQYSIKDLEAWDEMD